jgi:hypothetical protein
VHERLRRRHADLSAAPRGHDLVVLAPDPLAVLADVGEQRPLLLLDDR